MSLPQQDFTKKIEVPKAEEVTPEATPEIITVDQEVVKLLETKEQ